MDDTHHPEVGNLLPEIVVAPPGPQARALSLRLARCEAPGINTLFAGQPSLLWQAASGACVLDVDGNRYLDFTSGFGVAAVGHRHPAVVAAVKRQSDSLLHALGDVHAHPARVELAEQLAAIAPIDDACVYWAISGADAVEIALKTALLVTRRPGVLAFDPSYHGVTLGALAATSRPAFRDPFEAHLHTHIYRLPFACERAAMIEAFARAEANGGIGAVIVEPIVGREGILVPPPGFLAALDSVAKQNGALVIADEIFTGFGRTGSEFETTHVDGFDPQLLCVGKSLGGGLPIGAVIGKSTLLAAWESDGEARHTATFVGHPLSCAAGLAVLEVLERERLAERARALEPKVQHALSALTAHRGVTDVRGRGLLFGIELSSRRAATRCTAAALQQGLIVLAGGPDGRVVQVVPPLTITEQQLARGLEILVRAIEHPEPRG